MKKTHILLCILAVALLACNGTRGNQGQLQTFPIASSEPEWIRNGEPIQFEGELWYPQDGVESLMDSEVLPMGEYRNVRFFIDKIDVRPFDRLYTKFGNNKFRYFERQPDT